MSHPIILTIIYYWSFVFAFLLFRIALKKLLKMRVLWFLFWWILFWLFVRARFVEPQWMQTKETTIDVWFESDVALIADLHLWPYKWKRYLSRVVNEINQLSDIDAVLVAGDFTYEPLKTDTESLIELLSPLSELTMPVLAVLGNHDVQVPWPDLRQSLTEALVSNGVLFLSNNAVDVWNIRVVGLGPHMSGEDRVEMLDTCEVDDNVIVLTHNPDTISQYRNDNADITLVGHTHCGQVRLPFIHEYLRPYYYPVEWDFDCGLTKNDYTQLYITAWLGEMLLPMRFLNRPTIDVLHLR